MTITHNIRADLPPKEKARGQNFPFEIRSTDEFGNIIVSQWVGEENHDVLEDQITRIKEENTKRLLFMASVLNRNEINEELNQQDKDADDEIF